LGENYPYDPTNNPPLSFCGNNLTSDPNFTDYTTQSFNLSWGGPNFIEYLGFGQI